MESNFEKVWRLGPAAFVFEGHFRNHRGRRTAARVHSASADYRKWYFASVMRASTNCAKDGRAHFRGDFPTRPGEGKLSTGRIVETIALDAFEAAGPEESARLLKFLRTSGLMRNGIFEARQLTGWRRMRSLVALGRTRAPEGIPALAEAYTTPTWKHDWRRCEDWDGWPVRRRRRRSWHGGREGLTVPALPLQSALVQCCAERPQLLLPYVQNAEGRLREGAWASPRRGGDSIARFGYAAFVGDDLDELRAAAARAMSQSQSGLALDVLNALARDPFGSCAYARS